MGSGWDRQHDENPDVKEALKARGFVAEENLRTLDECCEMIGARPVQLSGKLHEVFVEEFKRELTENPIASCQASVPPCQSHLPCTLAICGAHWWLQRMQPRIMVS